MQEIFLTTLGISETFANNALQNQQDGVFVGEDKHGKHVPYNKTTKTAMDLVRRHIESFPVVDGHYTRKDSNRKCLRADLNIKRMYELYIVQCKVQIPEEDIVSQAVFRKIFNEEYNFSFHVTKKKDQCAVSTTHHQRNNEGTLTKDIKKAYDKHQARKIKAREEKKKDRLILTNQSRSSITNSWKVVTLKWSVTTCTHQLNLPKKKTEVLVPQQWATVMQMARRYDPYMIVPLKYEDIYNFKDLTKKIMKFRKEDVNGKKIKWLKIRWLRYTKENPDCILFKYKMDDAFREMKVAPTSTRGRAAEKNHLIKKYTSRQSISAANKKRLQERNHSF
ncbi:unnamed protein product [Mytilus coruscus]|uniref:Uncharacterized protein n=1 Tax=Mytilus coruscus TaxID=42192 RepID=A0A6J8BLG0_MYTCO|nr:unnamed protein product [Mytilus coruscus]